jgi:hypothetical protein
MQRCRRVSKRRIITIDEIRVQVCPTLFHCQDRPAELIGGKLELFSETDETAHMHEKRF